MNLVAETLVFLGISHRTSGAIFAPALALTSLLVPAVAPQLTLTVQLLSFRIPGPSAVISADIDKDNNPDLVVTSFTTSSVFILFGARSRVAYSRSRSYLVGTGPSAIVAADITGDGVIDLATSNYSGGTISLLVGNGDGTFQNARNSAVPQPHHLAAADLNGDGALDLVIAGDEGQQVSTLINLGGGVFGPATNMTSGGRPHAVACGDFDVDFARQRQWHLPQR